jgi:hypothetical protein
MLPFRHVVAPGLACRAARPNGNFAPPRLIGPLSIEHPAHPAGSLTPLDGN